MFSDHTSAATEFRSSWRQTRSVKEGGCQTERQETREATAQSTLYDEAGTQTEERMTVRLKPSLCETFKIPHLLGRERRTRKVGSTFRSN